MPAGASNIAITRDFRAKREARKFDGLLEFGKALPKLRRRVEQGPASGARSARETVLAAVVRLLDDEHIRVGNEEYAKENKSFGATTLRSRHVQRQGPQADDALHRQDGIVHEVTITDRNLQAHRASSCQELPGQMLFQYVNGDGEPQPVTSSDVNDYIREATGGDFTAKHFRTWGASVIAFEQLLKKAEDARISVKTMIEPVAEALGNTVGDEPQVLCPPGADRGGQGRAARPARRHGAAARAQVAVVARGRADLASSPRPRKTHGRGTPAA